MTRAAIAPRAVPAETRLTSAVATGATPMVDARRYLPPTEAEILFKLEKFNPAGSIKDRAAEYMIAEAERRGELGPGGAVIESSSGNLGIALAHIGALRGYRVVIIVDPKASPQNVAIMRAYGAEVVIEDRRDATGNFHETRIERARRMCDDTPGAFWVNQTNNSDNRSAHRVSTGAEIIADTAGLLDACVMAVSSGGHISGVAEALVELPSPPLVLAVDVDGSSVFGESGHPYRTPGMGLSWTPSILRDDLIDERCVLSDEACCGMARWMGRHGLLVGPSSGAVALAALALALRLGRGRIVAVLPDGGERYLDTVFNQDWITTAFGAPPAEAIHDLLHHVRWLPSRRSV